MSLISATRVVLSMRAACKILSSNDRFVTKAFSVSSNLLAFDKSKLKYTDKHEWINEADGTVGITDYAQVNLPAISHLSYLRPSKFLIPSFNLKDKLGEVVYIELPSVGAKFEKASQFATLESVKAVSECYMPASGTVREINKALQENPSQINKSPFDEGRFEASPISRSPVRHESSNFYYLF